MNTLPRPTLEQSLNDLRNRDTFKVVLDAFYNEREALFSELESASKDEIIKIAGKIAQADKAIFLLTQSNDMRPAGCNGWMTINPPAWLARLLKRYVV